MAGSMSSVIQHLRLAASRCEDAEWTDAQLLERFVKNHDRAALEVLVHRHGRMVWGVCCRLLRADPDAEDAFQAVFLVLVRRANAAPKDTVANWLYGVAHQTALKARATIGKRKVRETQVADMPEPVAPPQVLWDDVQGILDEELSRLSDKHRTVIVMCDLEGKTRTEVARRLGVPEGTIASRLARAHAVLAKRLTRRGITLSGGAVAGVLAQQAAAAALPGETVAATIASAAGLAAGPVAAGALAPNVAALVEGVLKAMLLSKLKMGAVWLLAGLLIIGSGVLAYQAAPGQSGADGRSTEAVRFPAVAAAQDKTEPMQRTSAWGRENAGLRCRARAVTQTEQNMPLDVSVQMQGMPKSLKSNVKRLNVFLPAEFMELTLTHVQTKKSFAVRPYDPTLGMPVLDDGKSAMPLDGTMIKPLEIRFPLVKLGAALEPGQYDCRVRYAFPQKRSRFWRGPDAAWEAAGFWYGTVETGEFRLAVTREMPKTKTVLLPKRLRLGKGLTIHYTKDDAESVELKLRNGHFVSAWYDYYENKKHTGKRLTGVPTPGDVNPIGSISDYKGGDREISITIEVFETADPPVHLWHPGPGSGGYQVLWRKTLHLLLTEKEIRKHSKAAPKPTSWFEGALAELQAPAVPGKDVFCRVKLQNAKDVFQFDITSETRIFRMVGDKRQPAQFTDLTRDSTIRAGYNGVAEETAPPVAHAQDIVIVKAAPTRDGTVFEGNAEVGPGVPFQRKDYPRTFLLHLSKSKNRIVFHVPSQAILVKVVDGNQRPALIADIINGSKLRVIAPGAQDTTNPPQMAAEQILILERPGQGKKPSPLPDAVVTPWEKAGAKAGWMRDRFWGMTFDSNSDDVQPGDLPAFWLVPWKAGALSKAPAPDRAFGICLHSNVTDAALKELTRFKHLQMLDLSTSKITDTGLKDLAALKELRTLYLSNTEVTDKGLKELAGLKHLQFLTLWGTKVTDAGLKELAEFEELRKLTPSEHMTNAGMKDLAKLKGLRELDLRFAKVTDAGLKDLTGLHELRVLLVPKAITDTGLKEVAKFKQLESLHLQYSRVSDAGMKELTGLAKLKQLNISDTAVGDAGLLELAALKRLERVNLSTANRVTEKTARKLEQAVPGLRVWVTDPR